MSQAHSGQQLYAYSPGAVICAVVTAKAVYDAGHLPGDRYATV